MSYRVKTRSRSYGTRSRTSSRSTGEGVSARSTARPTGRAALSRRPSPTADSCRPANGTSGFSISATNGPRCAESAEAPCLQIEPSAVAFSHRSFGLAGRSPGLFRCGRAEPRGKRGQALDSNVGIMRRSPTSTVRNFARSSGRFAQAAPKATARGHLIHSLAAGVRRNNADSARSSFSVFAALHSSSRSSPCAARFRRLKPLSSKSTVRYQAQRSSPRTPIVA